MAVAAGAALLAALVSANGIHDAKGNIIKGLAESELIMGRSGKLGDTPPSIEYWANKDPATRGPRQLGSSGPSVTRQPGLPATRQPGPVSGLPSQRLRTITGI